MRVFHPVSRPGWPLRVWKSEIARTDVPMTEVFERCEKEVKDVRTN